MFKHILIAVDGSELAARAATKGLELAHDLVARVTVVSVTELWSASEMAAKAARGDIHPTEDYEARAAATARKIFAGVQEEAERNRVHCQVLHVPDKRPAEGIVAAVEELGCDLIVMGTHGRRGVARLVLGSQASEVMARAKVPVMICP